MKYRVLQLPQFNEDVMYAAQYIARELQNPTAAMRLLDEVEQAAKSLIEMPCRCAVAPAPILRQRSIRLLAVRNYSILFVVHEESKIVTLLRFGLGARNWAELM